MDIFEKISDMEEAAKELANDLTDTAKLNVAIQEANDKRDRLYRDIGEFYYKQFMNEEEVHPVVYAFCEEVNYVEQQIHYYEEELIKIENAKNIVDVEEASAVSTAAPVIKPIEPDAVAVEETVTVVEVEKVTEQAAERVVFVSEAVKSEPKAASAEPKVLSAEEMAQKERSRAAIQSLIIFDPFVPKLTPSKPIEAPEMPVEKPVQPLHNIYPFVPKAVEAEPVQLGVTFQTIPLFNPYAEWGASGEMVIIGDLKAPTPQVEEKPQVKEEAAPEFIFCTACGRKLRKEAVFCSGCGIKLR